MTFGYIGRSIEIYILLSTEALEPQIMQTRYIFCSLHASFTHYGYISTTVYSLTVGFPDRGQPRCRQSLRIPEFPDYIGDIHDDGFNVKQARVPRNSSHFYNKDLPILHESFFDMSDWRTNPAFCLLS